MRIAHYLLSFICLFFLVPVLAIGKRKREEIPSGPIAMIRRVENETNRTVALDVINADTDWVDFLDIVPGQQMLNKRIPLSADKHVEYDLFRFNYALPEGQEPAEQFALRIARIVNKLDEHRNDVRVVFTFGRLDSTTGHPVDVEIFGTWVAHYSIHEHELDNYTIDILFRPDLSQSGMRITQYRTQE